MRDIEKTIFRFNGNRVRKLLEEHPMAKQYYEWNKSSGNSDAQALKWIFKEIIMEDPRLKDAYDGGRMKKKLGRAPLLHVPLISHREYRKNWKVVDEVVAKLGCNLTGFNPDWLIHYGRHSMDISYEVMRELALLLGYKWKD